MAKFKVMMTCFSADPSIRPYEEYIARYFNSREEAEKAVEKCVADELETLNDGEAEGKFIGNFGNEAHDAVVEFWEGKQAEGGRDMRPVTIYDIVGFDIRDAITNSEQRAVFEMVLDEACRQWCCFIDETPERKDGEGFANFFYEIFEDKAEEYLIHTYRKERSCRIGWMGKTARMEGGVLT